MPKSAHQHEMSEYRHDGAPDFRPLSARVVIAAKAHTLHCGCKLRAGLPYTRVACLVDGVFVFEKHHVGRLCLEVLH